MIIELGEWCNPNCIYILFGEIVGWALVLSVLVMAGAVGLRKLFD